MIALRAPLYLAPGIATALTGALFALRPAPLGPSAPELAVEPPSETTEIRSQSTQPACDDEDVSSIVIRGQFTAAHPDEGFAISFAGTTGQYTAMTDKRGYFEVRIPRDDFMVDLCALPKTWKQFSDEQLTLAYRIDFE